MVWLGVAPAAIEYFKKNQQASANYFTKKVAWIDVYHPVFLNTHDVRIKDILIGFVRLRISTAPVSQAIRRVVLYNLLTALFLTVAAVLALNALIGKYVLRPIRALQLSVARYKQGEFPESVTVSSSDEL